jgi:hypothetical protein
MIIPGYASATTFVANKVPAVLPSGDIHRRKTFGLFKPAYLVGVTSKWNDLLAMPFVHRALLPPPGRNIRATSDPSAWIFDRFVLTGPTLFLLAYTVGVWLRHEFPRRPFIPNEKP